MDDSVEGRLKPDSWKKRDPTRSNADSGPDCVWPDWDPNLGRAGTRRDVLPPQDPNASGVWSGTHPPLLRRNPPRTKVLRRQENEIGDARHTQIGADQETEKGHPNVTSVKGMDTS